MLEELPHAIDPLRLAHQHRLVQGKFALAEMQRIHESLCATDGEVFFEWLFSLDEAQRPMIRGWIKTTLPMICQRCLQPMQWQIDTAVSLMILSNEAEEDALSDEVDALTLHTTPVTMRELVENELILAIPLVPKHEVCPVNEYALSDNSEEKYHPFAALKSFKK